MSVIQIALATAFVLPIASAFLFPSGGGGCGCAPPPPPPCPPQLPPIMLPSLPPPPQFCPPQLPSIPPPMLPSLPSPCGCGGRKKREAATRTAVVSGQSGVNSDSLCNNPQIRRIILKNLQEDASQSKNAIHSELKARLGGEYVVVCAQGAFSFVADARNFCIDGSPNQTCYVFQTSN